MCPLPGWASSRTGADPGRGWPASDAPIEDVRAEVIETFRLGTDGSPLPGGTWPLRYAARRFAWHVLDHAWEIEDRTDPPA